MIRNWPPRVGQFIWHIPSKCLVAVKGLCNCGCEGASLVLNGTIKTFKMKVDINMSDWITVSPLGILEACKPIG